MAVFLIFLVWVILGLVVNNQFLLPMPQTVLVDFINIFTNRVSLISLFTSVIRLLLSMIFAFVFGFGFGLLAGLNDKFQAFVQPIVTVLRTIPVISITVILLIMLGFVLTPYVITFLMLFPLIFQGTFGAIKGIDQELIDVFKLENNQLSVMIRHCYVPLISRDIRTALLQSLGLGIKVLVMAEYLSQTKNSIGNQLYLAKTNLEFSEVFAWTLLLILLALGFEIIVNHYGAFAKGVLNNKRNKSNTD